MPELNPTDGERSAMRERGPAGPTRRAVLAAGATLGLQATLGSAARAIDEIADPFHDPSYSFIHTRDDLVRGLKPLARQAQEVPRIIKGIPVTGLPESLPDLDNRVIEAMTASRIAGVSIAIAKDNQLVCARGYGKASLVGSVIVEPTMPATIMSVNKPITVAAALTLVRDNRLRLDDLAFRLLDEKPLLAPGQSVDPRQYRIEVRQLMSHTSGLFNVVETLNDPPRFQALAARGDIRLIHGRIGQNDLVRIGMKEKLLFDPGTKYAYSGQGIQVGALSKRSAACGSIAISKRSFSIRLASAATMSAPISMMSSIASSCGLIVNISTRCRRVFMTRTAMLTGRRMSRSRSTYHGDRRTPADGDHSARLTCCASSQPFRGS